MRARSPLVRGLLGTLCAGLVATSALLMVSTEAAGAASTTLCSGGWACAGGGYSASSRSWADRYYYAGSHNCTRYAAHRLAVNGFPDPGRSWGNAYEWATRAPGVKNATPAVGAIAQWDRSATMSSGHVAYVEEVGNGYIVITEDNWGGVTRRRKLTPGSGWPTRFIHIKDVARPNGVRGTDVNGDGRTDLLYQDPNNTTIRLLTSAGTSVAGNHVFASGMGMSAWRVAGDFNGDGRADLLYQDPGSTTIRLLTSAGTTVAGNQVFASGMGMSAWRVAGDFNGDGRTDLLYQDPNNTTIRLLTSAGTSVAGNHVFASGMGMSAWRV